MTDLVAISRVEAVTASEVAGSACRSRWIAWVEASSLRRPSRALTAPRPGDRSRRAADRAADRADRDRLRDRRSRSRSRSSSNAQTASLWPKLVGSATTPCVHRRSPCPGGRRHASDASAGARAPRAARRRPRAAGGGLVSIVGGGEGQVDPSSAAGRSGHYDVDEGGDVVARDRLPFRHGLHGERRARPAHLRILGRHGPELQRAPPRPGARSPSQCASRAPPTTASISGAGSERSRRGPPRVVLELPRASPGSSRRRAPRSAPRGPRRSRRRPPRSRSGRPSASAP